MNNEERISIDFLSGAIESAEEIVKLVEFYKSHMSLLEDHLDSLKSKITIFYNRMIFCSNKAAQWYKASLKNKEEENAK